MTSPIVFRSSEADEYYFHEGCHILERLNDPADPLASIARARVAPGVTTRWHSLDAITERYVIIDGQGVADVGDAAGLEVGPGDVVLIPPGVRQRISNTGAADLVFLAVCTPRFEPHHYREA